MRCPREASRGARAAAAAADAAVLLSADSTIRSESAAFIH
jgi:hypothetical protein